MTDCVNSDSPTAPSRDESWRMFDRIVQRYDFLNHVLSLRFDVRWRKQVARMLPEGEELRVLDLATGTGDLLLAVLGEKPGAGRVVGLDMAAKMLERCKEKIGASGIAHKAALVRGDAALVAARDSTFDAVTMAFGIRNMPDVPATLREARRVLKPGGRLLVLEFSLPRQPWRTPYLFYLRHVLTRVGRLVSGDSEAYDYLNRTIETFPCGEAFCGLMRDAGFSNVRAMPRTLGIATIYEGER